MTSADSRSESSCDSSCITQVSPHTRKESKSWSLKSLFGSRKQAKSEAENKGDIDDDMLNISDDRTSENDENCLKGYGTEEVKSSRTGAEGASRDRELEETRRGASCDADSTDGVDHERGRANNECNADHRGEEFKQDAENESDIISRHDGMKPRDGTAHRGESETDERKRAGREDRLQDRRVAVQLERRRPLGPSQTLLPSHNSERPKVSPAPSLSLPKSPRPSSLPSPSCSNSGSRLSPRFQDNQPPGTPASSCLRTSFSVDEALNPDDPVVKKSVEIALKDGNFKPLMDSISAETISADRVRAAAAAIRALTKIDKMNRARVATADGVTVLVALLSSTDRHTVEHAVTAIMNLSLTESVRGNIFATEETIPSLVEMLKVGSPTVKENAAAAIFALADSPEHKLLISSCGATDPLMDLLQTGSVRGQKDAALALFNFSVDSVLRREMLVAGLMTPLIEMLNSHSTEVGVEEKVVAIVSNLAKGREGRAALLAEDRGVSVLVDTVEIGSTRAKEDAVTSLLYLARRSEEAWTAIAREGPQVTFKNLSLQGTKRAREKATALLDLLKMPKYLTGMSGNSSDWYSRSSASSPSQSFVDDDDEGDDD